MITVLALLGILSTAAFVGSIRALRVDGYHRVPTRTYPGR